MKQLSKYTFIFSIIILVISFFVVMRPKKETVLKIKTESSIYFRNLNELDQNNDTICITLLKQQ